jgi:hypothetical protein
MRIAVRNKADGPWRLVESAEYGNEAELQVLLAESPSLISVDEIRDGMPPLVAAVREFGLPGSGSTDLLAFSAEGDVAVIECKLAANQEIRRKVVGQILEYAAYLWGMSYEELDERVSQRTNQRLAEWVGAAADPEAWDEEAFRSTVAEALEKGRFILIIAVDEINEELARTIRFLNGCAQAAFSFRALEMRRFQQGPVEMLVPHVHGAPPTKPSPRRAGSTWTEARFLDVARASVQADVMGVIAELYEWSTGHADEIRWGKGKEKGSFSFYYHHDGTPYSVFSVLTDGQLWINYNSLGRKVSEEGLQAFHAALHEIEGFRHIPADFGKWPVVWVEKALAGQPGAVERFEAAVAGLGEWIRGTA